MKTLTINGQSLTVEAGTTILEAAKTKGIFIPHYCYHPKLSIVGCCRMCLVEIEGQPKLQPACRTPVEEGMVVHTNSPKALRAQRAQLEFLLLNHPIDCPICDQAGECGLQDFYMLEFGGHKSRVAKEEKLRRPKAVDLGPHIIYDAERCILCTRCIRFCQEIAKQPELGIINRGNRSQISTFPNRRLENPYSLNTVDICPVGALTSKDFRFKIRPWFLYSVPSICPGCAQGCNIYLQLNKRFYVNLDRCQIYRIKPRENPEVNDCWLCDEGRLCYKSVQEDRVLQPHLRRNGKLVPVGWDQALEEIKGKLRALLQDQGPQRIGALISSKCSNEAAFIFKRFVQEVLKSPHIDHFRGKRGFSDDFLLKEDKTPNSCGMLYLNIRPGPNGLGAEDMLTTNNGLKALYIVGGDPVEQYDQERLKALFSQLDLLIFQTSNFSETCQWAHILLPSTTFAEIDGTFTNYQGRVQRLFKALDPLGDSLPHEFIITRLARALGHEWPEMSPAEIMEQISREIPKYQGLDYGKIGEKGVPLGDERPMR